MDFDNYVNKKEYPIRRNYIKHIGYKNGEVVFTTEVGVEPTKEQVALSSVIEKIFDDNNYYAMLSEYRNEENRLYEAFKHDLFEEYGVKDNPKRDKLFNLAWEEGHSSGYYEVENYFSELVDLIK